MSAFLVLKVDVDTYHGTLEGVPRLLDLFAKLDVKATFLFSLGPDNTGKAIRRIFRKGFVTKVLSASPAASYGIRTMLYGTVLPAPEIGTRREAIRRMREVAAAEHEVGIHAWDHVAWHDRLPSMSREEVTTTFGRAAARFAEIFGERARVAGAPGWTANALSVEAYEAEGIEVSSDTRGGEPFFPERSDGRASTVLEIPSTLPTLDELLALPGAGAGSRTEQACESLRARVREKDRSGVGSSRNVTEVHSIHTEIEGGPAFSASFARLLAGWRSDGVRFLTLEEQGRTSRSAGAPPVRKLTFTRLPGRATPVATGGETA
ncbi:MAG TPA: polysaccharide deacetylase family protein [Thermoanaerobaculia bacterium]|nr:polysaccharide deacetylase family protein [Thermoanaerobaculia bacterium]